MDSVGEGEGGKIWEDGIETCKISCMKRKKKRNDTSNKVLAYRKIFSRVRSIMI